MLLGGLDGGRVIALAVEIGADPAGEIPIDVFVGGVELGSGEVLGKAEAATGMSRDPGPAPLSGEPGIVSEATDETLTPR